MRDRARSRWCGVHRHLKAGITTAALVVGLGACSSSPPASPAQSTANHNTCALSALDVPACGVLWGAYVPRQNYAPLETSSGRRLDIVKNYVGWQAGGPTFPNAAARQLAAGGRVLDFSWSPINFLTRAPVPYASIAAGRWDKSVILPEAAALKRLRYKVIVDFGHEFDSTVHANLGSAAQYVAAYQHIHDVMANAGVTNVIWAWVSTGYTLHESQIASYYPGSSYVDWIGYDPYNFAQCHNTGWKPPEETFQPFYDWLQTQPSMADKPIMLAEYGSVAGSDVQDWYAGVASALEQLPKIKAVMQFDDGIRCDFRLGNSSGALAGFTASGHSTYIVGQ